MIKVYPVGDMEKKAFVRYSRMVSAEVRAGTVWVSVGSNDFNTGKSMEEVEFTEDGVLEALADCLLLNNVSIYKEIEVLQKEARKIQDQIVKLQSQVNHNLEECTIVIDYLESDYRVG